MIAQPYNLYVERTDQSLNMARFYALSIEPTLFGETRLTRRWGRIGANGQSMTHDFAREQDAVILFLDLIRQKRKRGYVMVRDGSRSSSTDRLTRTRTDAGVVGDNNAVKTTV